ncbi:MAG TPA: hypothetical protein VM093_05585 [Aeromicrobium sp.]|nr:hypothetical protein [Aeromicrobium sp.]
MSAIASAATATVLALGVAVALDAQPAHGPRAVYVRHGAPGPAQVELVEQTGAPRTAPRPATGVTVDTCHAAPAGPNVASISPATRALSSWSAMSDALGYTQADPPRAGDLVNLALGPTPRSAVTDDCMGAGQMGSNQPSRKDKP